MADPRDPNSWLDSDYSPNFYGYTNPYVNPDPNAPIHTPPIHTPTPIRPQGFLPFSHTGPGFAAASSSPPLFPSPPQGAYRGAFSPVSRMSSFEEDDDSSQPTIPSLGDDSSRQTVPSLADESDPIPSTFPEEVSSPPKPTGRSRRGGGRGRGRRRRSIDTSQESHTPQPSDEGVPSQYATEPGPPRPYSEAETLLLGKCWVDIAGDATIGTNQRIAQMWLRIASRYNGQRPRGTPFRDSERLRNHWKRALADIKLFEGCYVSCQANVGSGENGDNLMTNAYTDFHKNHLKPFKYPKVWEEIRTSQMFKSVMGSSSAVKRAKQSYDGSYSNTGSEQEEDEEASGSAMAPYNPRPEGVKAAKARAKGKGKSRFSNTSSSDASQFGVPQPPTNELAALAEGLQFSSLYDAYTKPTQGMDEETLLRHNIMCDYIEQKLGLPSRRALYPPTFPPPPPPPY